jgi:hypothetical protein
MTFAPPAPDKDGCCPTCGERARVIEMCARLPDDLAENGGQIRLHMGELTAQEMRSVKAILRYIAAALRALGQQDTGGADE